MGPSRRPYPAHRGRRVRRPSAWLLALLLGAPLVTACATQATDLVSSTSLPDGVPVPSRASVVVGQGGGYDAGATLYAFSSDFGPTAALKDYEKELLAAGFTAEGSNGPWALYRHGAMLVAVRVGESGPPTDLLLKVTAGSGTGRSGGGNGSSNGTSGKGGTGGGSAGTAGTGGHGTGSGSAGDAVTGTTPNPGGATPNGKALGAGQGGDPAANGPNPGATPNPGGHLPGAGASATPPSEPSSGSAGSGPSGSVAATPNPAGNLPAAPDGGNGQASAGTPVPQPDPAHGQAPSAPPGQTKPAATTQLPTGESATRQTAAA